MQYHLGARRRPLPKRVVQLQRTHRHLLYVFDGKYAKPYPFWMVRRDFKAAKNLADFARAYDVSPQIAIEILTLAKVDFVWPLYKLHLLGQTCAEVAAQNGIKLRTLTKLFRSDRQQVKPGRRLKPGRRRMLPNNKRLKRKWKRTGNTNRFARSMRVHWQTAKKIHHRLFINELHRKRSPRMPASVNANGYDPWRRLGVWQPQKYGILWCDLTFETSAKRACWLQVPP